ncbi:MAG: Hpt domain-containing protein [Solidesulfovibrio sp.]
MRTEGHKLKGSARSYGFDGIGQAALELERAGEEQDAAAAEAALDRAVALVDAARRDWA